MATKKEKRRKKFQSGERLEKVENGGERGEKAREDDFRKQNARNVFGIFEWRAKLKIQVTL